MQDYRNDYNEYINLINIISQIICNEKNEFIIIFNNDLINFGLKDTVSLTVKIGNHYYYRIKRLKNIIKYLNESRKILCIYKRYKILMKYKYEIDNFLNDSLINYNNIKLYIHYFRNMIS